MTAKANKNDKEVTIDADYVLVAVGRRPYTEGLGLENIGIELDERGRVPTDDCLRTKHGHIFAIGDVTKGAMLAHKAEEEGVFVAEFLNGEKPHLNYLLVPSVVYTWPEVAAVGYTEQQLKDKKRAYKVGNFPFKASGRRGHQMNQMALLKFLPIKIPMRFLGCI